MDWYDINIAGALALFSIFLCYYAFSSSFSTNRVKNSPPAAGGARPFIGHLHVMTNGSPDKLPYIALSAMADNHGPIFGIRLGIRQAVVISNHELAKELYTKCDVASSSRPTFMASKLLGYNLAMFGFSPYSRYWREIRKLISFELLSSRRLDIQNHVLVSETTQSINELYKHWDKNKDESSGSASVEMKEWFGNLNLNVVLRMVVRKRYLGSGGDRADARHCRKVMRDFFHLGAVFTLGDALPYLGWLDVGGYQKKMKETSEELDSLLKKWLQEHRDKPGEGKEQDFMDVMLAVVRSAKLQSEYDDDTIIKSTCSNLISGASDTTSVMLGWSLALLLNNPKVLRKVQQELDQHVGRERRVNEADINNLVYLEAVVKETLRLCPAAPLSGIREFTQDCSLGGYHIKKGTWLLVNIWKLQRDPQVWNEDSSAFRPERFLTADGLGGLKEFQWIPFGGGRRICPGMNLGMKIMQLVLANMLHAFDFTRARDELVEMAGSAGVTNGIATPLDVLVAPRLSTTLYS